MTIQISKFLPTAPGFAVIELKDIHTTDIAALMVVLALELSTRRLSVRSVIETDPVTGMFVDVTEEKAAAHDSRIAIENMKVKSMGFKVALEFNSDLRRISCNQQKVVSM